MTKIKFLISLIIFLIAISASAHVCDDVLEFDPIIIWPEKEIIEIKKTSQFKIFLRNDYWESISQVRLIIPPSPFQLFVNPFLIEKIAPKEEVFFKVELTVPEEIKAGIFPLLIKINAQEFEIPREVNLTIKVKEPPPEAVIEIVPQEIPIAFSVLPEEIEIEPGKSQQFRVFVRNGYNKSLHHLTLLIKKNEFELTFSPEIIEELKPGETKFFLLHLQAPAEIKLGNYIMPINFKAKELSLERPVANLLIKVGKIWDWKTYLYLLIIVLIIFIVIWRWQRVIRKRSGLLLKQQQTED